MKLLILGGTQFVGRWLVEAALASGHEVTLFNRGQTNRSLFPHIEKLRGNRDGDLAALRGRRWDSVIDTTGYVPRIVRQSADLLADAVEHYCFVSTVSVYADFSRSGLEESASVGTLRDRSTECVTNETYGPLKARCEQVVLEAMPGRALIPRPGLIVGPFDPTDRFTYWPHRVARGGDVLAPGRPDRAIQFIDVRDLAEWIVRLVEAGATGIYNATGPAGHLAMSAFLQECKEVSGSNARVVWMDEEFLEEREVKPWIELPLWMPGEMYRGLLEIAITKAVAAGLSFRPLAQTVRDTLDWEATRPSKSEWKAGMSAERERELFQDWWDTRGAVLEGGEGRPDGD